MPITCSTWFNCVSPFFLLWFYLTSQPLQITFCPNGLLQRSSAKLYSIPRNLDIQEEDPDLTPTQLTDTEEIELEKAISKKKLDSALKTLGKYKSSGPDGYSSEFYKKILATNSTLLRRL